MTATTRFQSLGLVGGTLSMMRYLQAVCVRACVCVCVSVRVCVCVCVCVDRSWMGGQHTYGAAAAGVATADSRRA
jgi:hypothetical protein